MALTPAAAPQAIILKALDRETYRSYYSSQAEVYLELLRKAQHALKRDE